MDRLCVQFRLKNITFTHQDALSVDYQPCLKALIIANIPYQITSPLIETLTHYKHHLGPIIMMIQKDVADAYLPLKIPKHTDR